MQILTHPEILIIQKNDSDLTNEPLIPEKKDNRPDRQSNL